jgi:hypothetical protein
MSETVESVRLLGMAERIRTLADRMYDVGNKRAMLDVADAYERLAKQAETPAAYGAIARGLFEGIE